MRSVLPLLVMLGCSARADPVVSQPPSPTPERPLADPPASEEALDVAAGQVEAAGHRPRPASDFCPPTMVELAPATFSMGATEDEPWWAPIMSPPRSATVDARYCLDQTEVTVASYAECVNAGRCTATLDVKGCNLGVPGREQYPVNCVDWYQAQAYCAFRGSRLPTEEEWELAARGPEGRPYPWGDADPMEDDAVSYATPGQGTWPVGQRPKADTPLGIWDLGGNVWEWTSSPGCMHEDPGCKADKRVAKGGGTSPTSAPGANRFFHSPGAKLWYVGFRCAWPSDGRDRAADKSRKPAVLHWSMLQPRVDIKPKVPGGLPFGGKDRVICMTRVVIDGSGRPKSAEVVDTSPTPDAPVGRCTKRFAEIAQAAAMAAAWWPTFERAGAISTIPVMIDRP